jgi:hypothetical protein
MIEGFVVIGSVALLRSAIAEHAPMGRLKEEIALNEPLSS